MATQEELAAHLDLSDRQIRDLAAREVLPRARRGQWDLDACRLAYLRHLRELAAGRDAQLAMERARLAKGQADAQEMKNAQLRGELIPREDVVVAWQSVIARSRARLLSLPGKAAPLVAGLSSLAEIKELLTDIVHDALAELASAKIVAISEAEDRPGDGRGGERRDDGLGPAAAPDGQRVGRSASKAKPGGKRRTR